MTTTHTPGPWQAVQMYSDALTVLDAKGFEIVEATRTAILPDYEERIGVGHWALSEQAHRYLSDEEQAANARLIAAAPELLEALEWALRAMEARNPLWAEGERFIAARAAIAKAKGEQQ